jgi:hypothetical protein
MMPIWKVQRSAVTVLVITLGIPAIAGISVELNQDAPSWLYHPLTGIVSLVVIGAALAVLTTTLFIVDEEEE